MYFSDSLHICKSLQFKTVEAWAIFVSYDGAQIVVN